jgi:hypothetical protein
LGVALNRYNHSGDPLPDIEEFLNAGKLKQETQSIDDMVSILKSITLGLNGKVEVKE